VTDLSNLFIGIGGRMNFKRVKFIVMLLSILLFTGSSFGFDLGGVLNSITKELEKGTKELEKGLQQNQQKCIETIDDYGDSEMICSPVENKQVQQQPQQTQQPISEQVQKQIQQQGQKSGAQMVRERDERARKRQMKMEMQFKANAEEDKRRRIAHEAKVQASREKDIADEKARREKQIADSKARIAAAEEQRIAEEKAAEEQKIADAKAAAKAAEEQRIVDNAMKGIKPERQKEFLSIVKTHADKYAKTKKEIKRSLYRKKRMKAFSEYFNEDLCFNNWVGTVKSLDTDKNGDAILAIDIGGFNFLNYGSKAIPMSNSLFDTLAEMEENDKVVLEGCFSKHNDSFADNWYLFTHEKTEKGSMTSPTFQGSYSDIKKTN
jgi:hypothetical protein